MNLSLSKNNYIIVIVSLMTLIMFSVYLFGLRVLALLLVNIIVAGLTEFIFQKKRKRKYSKEVLISAIIFTLILPPRISFAISSLGMFFGMFFGKLVYGGYGHNIFNPALVGRVFIHASFINEMRLEWTRPVEGFFGGFGVLLGKSVNGISSATPLQTHRWSGVNPDLSDAFWGFTEGCIGETSAFLLILIGAILIFRKIIAKDIIFSILLSYLVLNMLGYQFLDTNIINPLNGMLSGDLLIGSILLAPDPVTSPKSKEGRILYGIIIGVTAFSIRTFSLFTGGIMFAILIGNMVAPILDIAVKYYRTSQLQRGVEHD